MTRMHRFSVLAAALAAAFALAPAFANNHKDMKSTLSAQDTEFVAHAAIGGMTEVKLGKIAQQNSQNAVIRNFGKAMVDDHSKANDKLKAIATKKGMTMPKDPDAEHKAAIDMLAAKKGADFDTAYAAKMKEDHDKTIDLFRAEADEGSDADLRQFAKDTLPTLEHHKAMTEKLDTKASGQN